MKPHATKLLWLLAVASKPEGQTPADWIAFCLDAAREAEAAVHENPPTHMRKKSVVGFLLDDIRRIQEGTRVDDLEPHNHPEFEHDDLEPGELDVIARSAAATAFRCCMPQLVNRRNTTAYIACVAVGMQHNYLDAKEAKSLMYTAQLALSAFRPRQRLRRSAA